MAKAVTDFRLARTVEKNAVHERAKQAYDDYMYLLWKRRELAEEYRRQKQFNDVVDRAFDSQNPDDTIVKEWVEEELERRYNQIMAEKAQ